MHQQGSKPIDGIFMSYYLISSYTGGYVAFGKGVPSDHQALWLDIPAMWFYPLDIHCLVKFEAQPMAQMCGPTSNNKI